MELLGDIGHVESLFFLFGDIVSVGASLVSNATNGASFGLPS